MTTVEGNLKPKAISLKELLLYYGLLVAYMATQSTVMEAIANAASLIIGLTIGFWIISLKPKSK